MVFPEEIRTRKGYRIAGGWVADIPDYFSCADYRTRLISQILPELGYDRLKAEKEADRRIDEMARETYVHRLKEFIRRMADEYAKRFPSKVNAKTLDGFDPSTVATLFQPYRTRTGRAGSQSLTNLLSTMARKAPEMAPDSDGRARQW